MLKTPEFTSAVKERMTAANRDPRFIERIEGMVYGTIDAVGELLAVLPVLIETRDADVARRARENEEIHVAQRELRNRTLGDVERELALTTLQYPAWHDGYSAHPRYQRPVSLAGLENRHARAGVRFGARLRRLGITPAEELGIPQEETKGGA